MADGAGSAKVTWISVVVGVLGFGTAVVTNLDKIDKFLSPPAPVTGGQATSPSTYLSWKWTTYPPLARMSPVFISKWNKDCAAEGQTQLSSRGFSIYSRNETSVGGGGQFQGGSDVIMAISCRADAGRLEYEIAAAGPSPVAAQIDFFVNAMNEALRRPGAAFGQ